MTTKTAAKKLQPKNCSFFMAASKIIYQICTQLRQMFDIIFRVIPYILIDKIKCIYKND